MTEKKENTETAVATIQPITSPEQLSEVMAAAIEAAVRRSVGASAGPIPAFFINMLLGQIIRPVVDTLAAIVAHIGMAVPEALGSLVEKLESAVDLDLNGDGFKGDPGKDEKSV